MTTQITALAPACRDASFHHAPTESLPALSGLASLETSWRSVTLTPYFGPISKACDYRVI